MEGAVAYSPVIADLEQLMTAGWDEWYVNLQREAVQNITSYVNDAVFTLLEAPTPAIRAQQARFWRQLAALQTETYLSSNEARSIVVTRSKALHTAAVLALQTTIA